jgi:hypothetical protein
MAQEKEDEIVKLASMRHSSLSAGKTRYMSPKACVSAKKPHLIPRDYQCLKIENRFKSYEKKYDTNKHNLENKVKEEEDNQI